MAFRTLGFAVCLAVCCLPSASHSRQIPPENPWKPPVTTLTQAFVDAVAFVFDNGVPDVRGYEFHEVSLLDKPSSKLVKVSGWVIPATDNTPQRVICWNGIAYKSAEIGPKLDLWAFVESVLSSSKHIRLEYAVRTIDANANNPKTALGAALMLRLGEGWLAERIVSGSNLHRPYLSTYLCDNVLAFKYDYAVRAFVLANDRVALDETQWLLDHATSYLKQADNSELKRTFPESVVKQLNREAFRRLQATPHAKFDIATSRKLPMDQRVADLMDRLEDVSVPPQYFSILSFNSDPLLEEMRFVGTPMLASLVQCAEKDDRLTRNSTGDTYGGWSHRVIPTRELAVNLIRFITGLYELPRTVKSETDFNALAELVEKTKDMSVAERLVWVLGNDSSGWMMWKYAARRLTEPKAGLSQKQIRATPASAQMKVAPTMLGESLRTGLTPSITELMSKRALRMVSEEEFKKMQVLTDWRAARQYYSSLQAIEMARYLAKWDVKGGSKAFKELYQEICSFVDSQDRILSLDWRAKINDWVATLTIFRIQAGDLTAMADYEQRLLSANKVSKGSFSFNCLLPLAEYPEWGDRVAQALLSDNDALWIPTTQLHKGNRASMDALLRTKLLVLPAVREYLIKALKDETVIGETWRKKERGIVFKFVNHIDPTQQSFVGINADDPRDPAPDVKSALRACDLLGYALSSFSKAPRFRPCWSIKDRDEALAEVIEYVRTAGDKLYSRRPEISPTFDTGIGLSFTLMN